LVDPPARDLDIALEFLAQRQDWRYEPEMLNQLLAHPEYVETAAWFSGSSERWQVRRFPFRAFALNQLKRMGVTPANPVGVEKRLPAHPGSPGS
jgi:hypothetical protein